ncbi:hypothetical protein GXW82_07770 [Streptacidiphilus sp. 4-A2]|nr:hypothetical protein [Streptacidiphilus sp. 4-A2]
MRFNLLGPLSVSDGDAEPVLLPAGIPRTVLAVLLLNVNQVVSADRLAQAVWGEERPSAAAAGLRNHVSRLRRQLGGAAGARVRTEAPGYLVAASEEELDEQLFLQSSRRGREALEAADYLAAADELRQALDLWRGEPLADMPPGPEVDSRVQWLRETRLLALEGRIEADLWLGRHQELVAEIRALTDAHPLRETVHGQLMLALYRAGRQAEALDAFQELRHRLVEELGVDPSPDVQRLHGRILGADPELAVPPAAAGPGAPVALRAATPADRGPRFQLPADTRAFTGRGRELARLVELADEAPGGSEAGMVVISAIDGMAGIGKSALAIRAAHRIRDRFPDGQLFVDLHGHTPGTQPLEAGDALDWFLRSLGVPPQLIPRDVGERSAFYRDRLADTRTLIVLDNAANTAQVRPLLPASPGCLVLVTSRRRLTGLDDAHTVTLDLLPEAEAVALLRQVAGADRVPEGHPAIAELLSLSGHLPLAIRITAARLRHRRALRLEDVVEQLRDEHRRLDYLQDEDRNLTAVFESSRTTLPAAERRLFRLLGLVPGPDFDGYAAAALAGVDRRTAERLLESLLDHNLLIQHTVGRYRFHDLVRLYARTLSVEDPEQEREGGAALGRLLDYQQHSAQAAYRRLVRYTRPAPPPSTPVPAEAPEFADRDQALRWLRTERQNLLAGIAQATTDRQPDRIAGLSTAMAPLLHLDGPWPQAIALSLAAAATAQEHGDRLREADALWELGRIRLLSGQYTAAIEQVERVLGMYQELGNRQGEANCLDELGRLRGYTQGATVATGTIEQALEIFRETGDRQGEANALWNLGGARLMARDKVGGGAPGTGPGRVPGPGRPPRRSQRPVRAGPGAVLRGEFTAAAELQQAAIAAFQEVGNRLGESGALTESCRAGVVIGDIDTAAGQAERALAILQELGSPLGVAVVGWDLGRARLAQGDREAARTLLERSLGDFERLGARNGQANALHELGRLRCLTGEQEAGTALLERSLAIFEQLDDCQGQAEVLISTAEFTAATTGPERARELHRRALDLALNTHSPLEQARALEGAARCSASLGELDSARVDLGQAVALYRRMGVRRSAAAAEQLLRELPSSEE